MMAMPDNRCIFAVNVILQSGDIHPQPEPSIWKKGGSNETTNYGDKLTRYQRRTKNILCLLPISTFALWRPVQISIFSKTWLSITDMIFFTISESWKDHNMWCWYPYSRIYNVMRISLFLDIQRSGKIEGYIREVVDYWFMSKTYKRPRWLKNGPLCRNPIFNSSGWKYSVRNLNLFFSVQSTGHQMPW